MTCFKVSASVVTNWMFYVVQMTFIFNETADLRVVKVNKHRNNCSSSYLRFLYFIFYLCTKVVKFYQLVKDDAKKTRKINVIFVFVYEAPKRHNGYINFDLAIDL